MTHFYIYFFIKVYTLQKLDDHWFNEHINNNKLYFCLSQLNMSAMNHPTTKQNLTCHTLFRTSEVTHSTAALICCFICLISHMEKFIYEKYITIIAKVLSILNIIWLY